MNRGLSVQKFDPTTLTDWVEVVGTGTCITRPPPSVSGGPTCTHPILVSFDRRTGAELRVGDHIRTQRAFTRFWIKAANDVTFNFSADRHFQGDVQILVTDEALAFDFDPQVGKGRSVYEETILGTGFGAGVLTVSTGPLYVADCSSVYAWVLSGADVALAFTWYWYIETPGGLAEITAPNASTANIASYTASAFEWRPGAPNITGNVNLFVPLYVGARLEPAAGGGHQMSNGGLRIQAR